MNELKHCPRCGPDGKAVIDDLGNEYFGVICKKCGLRSGWYASVEEAVAAWNPRPYEDELAAERDRFRERCAELESRLDLGTGNMYDVVCTENEKLREAIARANAANMSEDECISKLLDDYQVTITIKPKTLPDNQEDDCEPDGTD